MADGSARSTSLGASVFMSMSVSFASTPSSARIFTGPSSKATAVSAKATGASFTPVTRTRMVAVATPPFPSPMVYSKLSMMTSFLDSFWRKSSDTVGL